MTYPIYTFSKLVLGDLFNKTHSLQNKEKHLESAVNWLKLAHNKAEKQGVSYGFSLNGAWRAPYRETTGYIATTFFNLAKFFDDKDYYDRAVAMCEWELTVQNSDGSISNPHFNPGQGIVFDTGQVLFGLVRGYEETQDPRFLEGARRAGNWLVDVAADEKGRWTKCTHKGIPHVYNSRVAWAMLNLNVIDPNPEWVRVAKANCDFASENLSNGWFDQCAFETGLAPFTHTIAYAIRGCYESSQLLQDDALQSVAETVAKSCITKTGDDGFIPGQISITGDTVDSYCCLTGNCQLAIVWAKMFKKTGDESYRNAAVAALKYVMSKQDISTSDENIRGAIKGSHPTWGPYSRLTYPNWPTKFFVDAILECWDWL